MTFRMVFAFVVSSLLINHVVQARPPQRPELRPMQPFVDVVGDIDRTTPAPTKAAADTIWIATWNFEGCDETDWERSDFRLLNDGSIYWSVQNTFHGIGNISGNAAAVGKHDLCWPITDGYANDWNQGICIHYVGDSFLSFDFLVDSESGFDFLQVETDSACSSFGRVDYEVNRSANAQALRDLQWSTSGFDTATARVDSITLPSYASADTHCVYIAFFSDGAWSPADGLVASLLGVGAVVDNVVLTGALPASEDFSSFTQTPGFSFANLHDTATFGAWARTFQHITDNDLCTENPTCAWLATDFTTPTLANDPSMAFGPNSYVIRNWLDEVLVGPWVSLSSTAGATTTFVQFRRFGGNNFSTSRIVQNWAVRGRGKVANTDTPAAGDSIDCLSGWGHGSSWNSISTFSWRTLTWDATSEFDANAQDIQLRFRESDWQWISGAAPPTPFIPGPGPYWDRVRIGRQVLTGPVMDLGIDGRSQAQDAAPNDPAFEAGPMYAQAAGDDIFGTTAFSMSGDRGTHGASANLIVGDSITCHVLDVLGNGGVVVEWHASIVDGPHAGKSPAPYPVGANGFFVVPADSVRSPSGAIEVDRYFVDLDDTYFRGGDALRYFWYAFDQKGGTASIPDGLAAIPPNIAAAETATGGLLEVNTLPSIDWDPAYLDRIAADPHGDLEPTPTELANSSQANCILYYNHHNSARRSGDANRTSFMYTLDKLGYRDRYDVYDHSGMGNTNNHLGARMSPGQARYYSLLVLDAGNRNPGAPILPDGVDLDAGKINMSTWFQTWNSLSGAPNAEHTLWILGSNAVEERPADPLYAAMGASFAAANQGQDSNPDVFGIADFSTHTACLQTHSLDQFALNGGCPIIRNYDDIRAIGTGVQTHVYGKGSPSSAGAIVMHANVAGYTTILQSFPWFDIRAGIAQAPTKADEMLMSTILSCALPANCLETPNTTDIGDDKDQIATPSRTALHQNSPNPFNPMTEIHFDLAQDSYVSLKIYDVAGRLVRRLAGEKMTAGFNKQVIWNGLDETGNRVSSGVYFYRLEAADFQATRKMVVMK